MKKAILIILALALLLSLAACGEISAAKKAIDAIGEVTLESGDAIQAAQDAYDLLSDKDKEKVTNYDVLVQAHQQYSIALKEKAYTDADIAFQQGDFSLSRDLYASIADYKDASEKAVVAEKAGHYQTAEAAYIDGDYALALSEFTEAGDYSDAVDRAKESELAGFYSEASEKFEKGFYVEAAELFNKAKGFSDATDKIFESGKKLLDKSRYADAANAFGMLSSRENVQAYYYKEYSLGFADFNSNDFNSAKTHFESAADTLDAPDMINACILMSAEDRMEIGYLNTAKDLYLQLPEDYSFNGIEVSERLAKLEEFDAFVKLCGKWKAKEMKSSVRQTHPSTGLWDEWYATGSGYMLEITCTLNDDDTASIKAVANFWHYTNYSSLSKNLKTSNDSCTFRYTGKTVPYKLDYSLNFTYEYSGTLTISNQTFKLDYQILDKNSSINFNYTYKTNGTYDTLVTAY